MRTHQDIHFGSGSASSETAAPVCGAGFGRDLYYGISIKASKANDTDIIYVGAANVTTANGYPLSAGEELFLPASRSDGVYVIGSGAFNFIAC